MPSCQLMHGNKKSCEESYVLFSFFDGRFGTNGDLGPNKSHAWAEPCMFWENDGEEACLPFPPCHTENLNWLSWSPTVAPTQPPTTECGLELPKRKEMPSCQVMHGQGKEICESSYVQFTIGRVKGESKPMTWLEPCAYYDVEGGVCLPFPPCLAVVHVPTTPAPTFPHSEEDPCDTMYVSDNDGMFNGTFGLQEYDAEPHKGMWWKDSTTGYEIYYSYEGVLEGKWTVQHPTADYYAVLEEGAPLYGNFEWQVFSRDEFHMGSDKFVKLSWECVFETSGSPSLSPTFSPTTKTTSYSPTFKPTTVPTRIPTQSAQIDCASQNKAKCKNTEGCRFVNNRKGCQTRIRPCSFLGKKNQCKNSHGCKWGKKSRVCEERSQQ